MLAVPLADSGSLGRRDRRGPTPETPPRQRHWCGLSFQASAPAIKKRRQSSLWRSRRSRHLPSRHLPSRHLPSRHLPSRHLPSHLPRQPISALAPTSSGGARRRAASWHSLALMLMGQAQTAGQTHRGSVAVMTCHRPLVPGTSALGLTSSGDARRHASSWHSLASMPTGRAQIAGLIPAELAAVKLHLRPMPQAASSPREACLAMLHRGSATTPHRRVASSSGRTSAQDQRA